MAIGLAVHTVLAVAAKPAHARKETCSQADAAAARATEQPRRSEEVLQAATRP